MDWATGGHFGAWGGGEEEREGPVGVEVDGPDVAILAASDDHVVSDGHL